MAERVIPRRRDLDREIEERIEWLLMNDATLRNRKHVIRCAINHFYEYKKKNLQRIEF